MGPAAARAAEAKATVKPAVAAKAKKAARPLKATQAVKPARAGKHSRNAPDPVDQVGPADLLEADSFGLRGQASFYGRGFSGRKTATGEIFDVRQFTAASNRYRLGTLVAVHRLDNDRCAIVKVNDRMHGKHRQRVIDVSRGAAEYLDMIRAGVVMVRVVALPQGAAGRDAGSCRSAVEATADWETPDGFSARRGQPEKMPEIEIGPVD